MITQFKIFENMIPEFSVGDYILTNYPSEILIDLRNFINNTIGIIDSFLLDDYAKPSNQWYRIYVKYDNIPDDLKMFFIDKKNNCGIKSFKYSDVVATGKTLEELEINKNLKKFNL